MIVGVTGASGFVGGHVLNALTTAGYQVRAFDRTVSSASHRPGIETQVIGTLGSNAEPETLARSLDGLDAVVHLAARVHVMDGGDEDSFRDVNVEGSRRLMQAACYAGVRQFVFLSSVKAVGERSISEPLNSETPESPEGAYGRSKLDAERALRELADHDLTKLLILRPPFVYGWPPSGNFKAVVKAARHGWPLPFAGIRNRRDMIYVGNLADAIVHALGCDGLGQNPYFVSDGAPVSTPEFFRLTAEAFAKPCRLFYVPTWLLRTIGRATGKSAVVQRLTENLEVDDTPFRRDARWKPPYNIRQGLEIVAQTSKDPSLGRT